MAYIVMALTCSSLPGLYSYGFDVLKFTWRQVDVLVCPLIVADCEFYLPFNKSILLHVSAPLALRREHPTLWRELLRSVQLIASRRENVVASASTHYYQAYLRYFTSVSNVLYWPFFDMALETGQT